jgi:putative heme-binding domain-containing protein
MTLSQRLLLLCLWLCPAPALAQTLERELLGEESAALARAARKTGDPARGAVLFHRPEIACTKCHAADGGPSPLGPDLTRLDKDVSDVDLVEAVLRPSRTIRKGFETVTVTTTRGQVLAGLVAEDTAERLVLREAVEGGRTVTLARGEVEQRVVGQISLMPAGMVNGLAGRQDFLDLVRYLVELRDGGVARARQLQPPPSAYALRLPEYEARVDHAGLIAGLNGDSLRRGDHIYHRLCVNCHGSLSEAGSLPTSPRFFRDRLKNGTDPYAMYRTLTHGFGLMTPQTWMVPRQKYDVIHFVREVFFRRHNPSQYSKVDRAYLDRLPKGDTHGPKPTDAEPWTEMDYGPYLTHTYEIPGRVRNLACKGIAIRLDAGAGGVAHGRAWLVFDHDTLRVAGAWTGKGFIDWNGIQFNGRHGVHPHAVGEVGFSNPMEPGWADPETGSFNDPRPRDREGRPYGPLPRAWGRYRGTYLHCDRVILAYSVGATEILETHAWDEAGKCFLRRLDVAASAKDLALRLAPKGTHVAVAGPQAVRLEERDGHSVVHIPAEATPVRLSIRIGGNAGTVSKRVPSPEHLQPLTQGGPRRWPETFTQPIQLGKEDGPFAVDVLTMPAPNPWRCQLRLTGLDFTPDGRRAYVCTWDGDVWLLSGLGQSAEVITWQRIASGLFQPLGIKLVNGQLFVGCRDQIVRLHDLNGDGEIDFYECFNADHQVTEHFHEFAMGLQADAEGNLYYAKAARHALPALVPQHGTLLKVSRDGGRTEILATGFRAPNGVCLNEDGTFFVTDQEGHWTPKNRINWVQPGGFFGNMMGYHTVSDASDAAMRPPVCWITNLFDRSPAELLWVTSDRWGPLKGSLLNLSYGYGKVYVVPHERRGGVMQGGMCALPIPSFPTGTMRGRFHPVDGQLYLCGMYSWAGSQQEPGGLFRIRYTGKPVHVPIALHAKTDGLRITFSGELASAEVANPANYAVKVWGLKRSAQYGSAHHDERTLKVVRAVLEADGRTVQLDIPDLKPTWCMEIKASLKDTVGRLVNVVIHNTIHRVGPRS